MSRAVIAAFKGLATGDASLALITESAEHTALLAANIGGDSDSVASIGSAIAGALHPATVNEGWYDVVSSSNDEYDLVQMAVLSRRKC